MALGSVRISAKGDQDELRSIAKWLRAEEALRGQVSLVDGPARPGRMGGVLDAVAIAIGSGGAGTVLIHSLFTYLGLRRTTVVLELKLKREDGRELDLKLTGDTPVEATMQQALQFFDDPR